MGTIQASKNEERGLFIKSIVKGVLLATSVSLILICVFAFLLRFVDISVDYIKPINQVIKILSILLGTFVGLKKMNEMGLIAGFLIGFLYTVLAFFVFSLLNGGLSFNPSLINDLIFGGICGAISGVISVNLFSRRK